MRLMSHVPIDSVAAGVTAGDAPSQLRQSHLGLLLMEMLTKHLERGR